MYVYSNVFSAYTKVLFMNRYIVTGDDTPQLGDLCTNIVEHYEVHWYELGLKLGLKDYQLANIPEID